MDIVFSLFPCGEYLVEISISTRPTLHGVKSYNNVYFHGKLSFFNVKLHLIYNTIIGATMLFQKNITGFNIGLWVAMIVLGKSIQTGCCLDGRLPPKYCAAPEISGG